MLVMNQREGRYSNVYVPLTSIPENITFPSARNQKILNDFHHHDHEKIEINGQKEFNLEELQDESKLDFLNLILKPMKKETCTSSRLFNKFNRKRALSSISLPSNSTFALPISATNSFVNLPRKMDFENSLERLKHYQQLQQQNGMNSSKVKDGDDSLVRAAVKMKINTRCKKCNKADCLLSKPTPGFYLPEVVAKHCKETDCWIVAHGVVYDATRYLYKHPGGKDSILLRSGLNPETGELNDASKDFDFHSKHAKNVKWHRYKIGYLAFCNNGKDNLLNRKNFVMSKSWNWKSLDRIKVDGDEPEAESSTTGNCALM